MNKIINIKDHKPFITVYKSICDYKAVMMSWRKYEDGSQYEPDVTGYGSYDNIGEANKEGKQWAADEEIEFKK